MAIPDDANLFTNLLVDVVSKDKSIIYTMRSSRSTSDAVWFSSEHEDALKYVLAWHQ